MYQTHNRQTQRRGGKIAGQLICCRRSNCTKTDQRFLLFGFSEAFSIWSRSYVQLRRREDKGRYTDAAVSADELRLIRAFDRSTVVLSGMNWLNWIFVQKRHFENHDGVVGRLAATVDRLVHLRIN